MFLTTPRWWLPLFMPSTFSLLLIAVGLVLVWLNRANFKSLAWRAGAAMNACGALVLYVACTPLAATWLAASLERMVPSLRAADAPPCDAIVVLGSTFRWHRDQPDQPYQLSAMTYRLLPAVEAFKLGKAPLLVLGGGGHSIEPSVNEGNFHKQLAIDLGIPAGAIVVGTTVSNTQQEAIDHATTLRKLGARRILLSSSAFHLPRASMQFRSLGFEVVELPSHYLTAGIDERFSWRMLLPRGMALEQTEACVKECLGLVSAMMFPAGERANVATP